MRRPPSQAALPNRVRLGRGEKGVRQGRGQASGEGGGEAEAEAGAEAEAEAPAEAGS